MFYNIHAQLGIKPLSSIHWLLVRDDFVLKIAGIQRIPFDLNFEVFNHMDIWVVVSKSFFFHPYLGKIPILTNIFQMGWNHQPDMIWH